MTKEMHYRLLLECIRSGQVSHRQAVLHINQDDGFKKHYHKNCSSRNRVNK